MPYDVEDRLTQTPKPLFPAVTPAPKGQAQPGPRELQSSGDIRILILDDDPHTCAVIQAALASRDFVIDVVSEPMMVESALAGAKTCDYLTKPFQVEQLREIVYRCLESKGLLRMTEDALKEALGAAIRERRKALGLTLANMSDRTGVSLGYLSQIELGKNSASIETLYRICLALGMKMSELFHAVQRN